MFSIDRLRQSLRLLLRHKRFAVMAILCLGIGIALNTTMYSVLDALINPRRALPDPQRVFELRYFGDYRRQIPVHDRNKVIQEILTFHEGAAGVSWNFRERIVERGNRLRETNIVSVTPNYFALLRLRPLAGRLLTPIDLGLDGRPVVIGERLWKQLFPEKKRFESSTILVNGEPRPVVGLMPYAQDFPGGGAAEVWQLALPRDLLNVPLTIVRLKPGVTPVQAEAELAVVGARFRQLTNEAHDSGWRLRSAILPPFRANRFHWAIIGSVFAVLLIACANLANLQLARGVSRARELATRSAIGASRADIIAQLSTETAWLALGGLAVGAVLTVWGIKAIDAFVPPGTYLAFPQVSWRLALFAVGATVFCLVLVGLAPAIKLSRVDIGELLKSGAGTGKARSARSRYGVLVVTEVALALALLASTSLLLKAALTVHAFNREARKPGLVMLSAVVTREGPADTRTARDWSDRLIQFGLGIDSVTGVAVSQYRGSATRAISAYDVGGQPVNKTPFGGYQVVSPDFLRVSRIPIVLGRDFSPGEFAEPQVIVDRAAANSLWPGRNPIGQQIKLDSAHAPTPWYRVVGVADPPQREYFQRDQDEAAAQRVARSLATGERFRGQVFVLHASDSAPLSRALGRDGRIGEFFSVTIRGRGDTRRLAMLVNRGFATLNPGVRASYPLTWEEMTGVADVRARHDFMATLFGTFAFFALGLAALGVYAIIAHMVAQRTREFGVRIAVGADSRDIRELVVGEGRLLALLGILVGVIITYYTAGYVREYVFSDWDRYDSRFFFLAGVVLFSSAWVASYLPARRAMRINPVEALRND